MELLKDKALRLARIALSNRKPSTKSIYAALAAIDEAMPTADQEPELYYLQDSRGYVGNCPLWWGLDSRGYTTRIDQAHRYTLNQAMAQHRCRDTDIPWPCSQIDRLHRPTIDFQDMGSIKEQVKSLHATTEAA